MSRYFNLTLKNEIRPTVIIANTSSEAWRQATIKSKDSGSQIVSLIEMFKVDARRKTGR